MTTSFSSTHFTNHVGWDQLAPQAPAHLERLAHCGGPAPAEAVLAHPTDFKQQIIATLKDVAERCDWILSATLTGSFLRGTGLEGISDIDFVVIVDRLNAERMNEIQQAFRAALEPVLAKEDYTLRINPTLGPLKFNDERTAVLHLMLYSLRAHVEHVIQSPFTCLDWQRSDVYFKRSLAETYPVFGLQPRHFVSARRSIQDYLRDYRSAVVSYRELDCEENGYREVRREKPMTVRDRHEFAYHILRFLMQNTLKLLLKRNEAPEGELLLDQFSLAFGDCGGLLRPLYRELAEKKRSLDFAQPLAQLDERLAAWIGDYERQFRNIFFTDARRHVLFRHAPTSLNPGQVENLSYEPRFLGRRNPDVEPLAIDSLAPLAKAVSELRIGRVFSSPLARCQQSLAALTDHLLTRSASEGQPSTPRDPYSESTVSLAGASGLCLPRPCLDARLEEIDYGHCEGLSAGEARQQFPRLAAAWDRGEDVRFPDGECTADVARRLEAFIDGQWDHDGSDTLTCTHNVVLRCL
ncbi:MAG TPA: histidine phosphatase family protein, partial [Pirellulaceae bacterium]|nr:histidine phosphatase family protein [Pirellulaceae bacterium]